MAITADDARETTQTQARGLPAFAPFAAWALVLAVMIGVSAAMTGEGFVYGLDDPLIHLAVAESILKGGYGVNFPELSAPSSSILFPWLLAGLLVVGAGVWAPLILTLAASFAALALWRMILMRAGLSGQTAGWAGLALMLATNGAGLVMIGMENGLHVTATLAAVVGFHDLVRHGRVTAVFVAGVVLGGLLRFEGLAVSGALLFLGLFFGRPWAMIAIGAALAACLFAHVAWMLSHGLPVLPSSVLVKLPSADAALSADSGGLVAGLLDNWLFTMEVELPAFMIVLGLTLAAFAMLAAGRGRLDKPTMALLAAAVLIGGAQLAVGRYGWLSRYEIYAISGLMALVAMAALPVLGLRHARLRLYAGVGFGMLLIAYGELFVTNIIATQNMAQQQVQMGKFARAWDKPIAVNDLGWVTWNNDRYVLDLWGLGSEEARLARADNEPGWMDALTRKHDADVAILHARWFTDMIPASWTPVATLGRTSPTLFGGTEVATFYATRPEAVGPLRATLADIAATAPSGSLWDLNPSATPLKSAAPAP